MSDDAAGKSKGGIARRDKLPASRRSEIAKRAAIARWGAKATHRGSFKDDFGIDVDCYVLDDEQKTAMISQRGMGLAIGLGDTSGAALPRFIAGAKIEPYIGGELSGKLQNPVVFQSPALGANPQTTVHGYDVTILIDLCKAIVRAENDGALLKRQQPIAKQAHIVLGASAKAGIKHLVYALSGYDATREEAIAAFKLYIREEARDYEREFPSQLYQEWYRLYQLPELEKATRPWKFKHLTVDQVYWPLAHSNGQILELTRAQKASNKERGKKLHQFLSEVGVKALRQHLGQLLGIAQVSRDQLEYEKHVRRIFGTQTEMDI